MTITPEKFSSWAILEIMGHQTYAGFITVEEIAGHPFLRIDVPKIDGAEAFVKYWGPQTVYAITPVSEQVARLRAQALGKLPMTAWDLPEVVRDRLRGTPAIPGPGDDYVDDGDDDDSDHDY